MFNTYAFTIDPGGLFIVIFMLFGIYMAAATIVSLLIIKIVSIVIKRKFPQLVYVVAAPVVFFGSSILIYLYMVYFQR